MNDKKHKIGVFTPLKDKLFFRDESQIGEEDLAFRTIAKGTIIDAYEYLAYYLEKDKDKRKKQQHKTTDVFMPKEIGERYDWINDMIGDKRRETLNIKRSCQIRNGYGEFNERIREIEKEFEEKRKKFNL
jgi:hypothetical protein